jgi:hypothetical protein
MEWSQLSTFDKGMAIFATVATIALATYVFTWRRKR